MTTSQSSRPASGSASSSSGGESGGGAVAVAGTSTTELVTPQGKTSISDSVVRKIAGIAAREVSGVYRLGGGGAGRAFGAIRERVSSGPNVSQGVSVEVGERQAAVDLDVVVEYGVSIVDLSHAIRRNVIHSVERMTGLEVTEVNIAVGDIYIPGGDEGEEDQSRVQ
jgi:uncharacterized alkaline shock family protein YloU